MAGSSSLLSLAAMAVLLVGPAAAQGPSPSKSPPSPSPTPQRRLLASFGRVRGPEEEKPPSQVHKDTPNHEGPTGDEGPTEPDGLIFHDPPPRRPPQHPPPRRPPQPPPPRRPGPPRPPPPRRRRRRHAPPPPPPVTPGPPPAAARAGSFAALAALESDAAGQGASSGAVSGRLGFGFAGSVAIGALVAGLVI